MVAVDAELFSNRVEMTKERAPICHGRLNFYKLDVSSIRCFNKVNFDPVRVSIEVELWLPPIIDVSFQLFRNDRILKDEAQVLVLG